MTEQTPLSAEPTAPAPSSGRNTKRLAIVGIAAAVVIAGGGGAYAVFKKLDGGGAQPHDVLPSSVIAYARVDLDPSAGQKIALLKLIRKFPDAARSIGIKSPGQDVRKLIFAEALKGSGCGLTYDKDIEPWIGNRLGVGLEKDAETPLVAVQVSDEVKARKGITALAKCGDGKAPGISFFDGYAVVAEKPAIADQAIKDAKLSPLADNKAFIEDFKDLGNQGVASVWADATSLTAAKKFGGSDAAFSGVESLEGVRSTAATLTAQSNSVAFTAIAHTDKALPALKPAKLTTLPTDTAFAISVAGAGKPAVKSFNAFIDGLRKSGEDPTSELASIKKKFGFTLPEDIETLLGDSLTLAIGSTNLETLPTLSSPADLAHLDIGLSLVSDPIKAKDLADRLVKLAERFGVPLHAFSAPHGAVISTDGGTSVSLGGSGEVALGKDDTFTKVVPDADNAFGALYVNIGAILDAISKAGPPPDIAKQIDQVKVLSALGGSVSKKSDHVGQATLRLSFNK